MDGHSEGQLFHNPTLHATKCMWWGWWVNWKVQATVHVKGPGTHLTGIFWLVILIPSLTPVIVKACVELEWREWVVFKHHF